MTIRLLAALVWLSAVSWSAQDMRASLARAGVDLAVQSEVVATLVTTCERCDWARPGQEAVLLELRVDGVYSQHVALVRGRGTSETRILLGNLPPGHHELSVVRDSGRSAPGAGLARVERIGFQAIAPDSPDFAWVSRAPFLRARPGTVERFSDVPLVMYAERNVGTEGPAPYDVQYTVIFTNEDGGTPTDRLMATWGRTTDIEFVYGITAAAGGQPRREVIQVEGHRWVDFNGPRSVGHPELWVATDNNMVADHGSQDLIRFAPAPVLVALNGVSREQVMDDQPWTYGVTSAEMLREARVTGARLDGTGKMADPRRYAVVEACGEVSEATIVFDIGVHAADGHIDWHASDLELPAFGIARGGCFRGGAPLPEGVALADLDAVRVRALRRPTQSLEAPSGRVVLTSVNQVMMLDADFHPVHVRVGWTGSLTIQPGGDGFPVLLPGRP